ncbi:MAG: hypothetical protein GXP18_08225 [Gammaproteobacteria bacterium]|nr:hypothetical protein [Gammaproteobacteria bacterium]
MLDWAQLLNSERRKPKETRAQEVEECKPSEVRTQIERDYDRILFSTPVRRLTDSFALSLYDELKQYYVPGKNKENI